MADLSEAQRKRAQARKRRRKEAEPEQAEPKQSEDGGANDDESQSPHHGVLQAAKVAAAVGAAGAAAAAAKALTSHDDDKAQQDADADEQAEQPEQPEPEAQQEQQVHEPEREEQEAEPQQPQQPERQPGPRQQQRRDEAPVAGAAIGQAQQVLDRAREQLEDLLGRPVESVSSLERTHDGWVLELDVVELKRIPESTDVLASYEMELDDDLNLRRYQQARRFTRGRADDREDS